MFSLACVRIAWATGCPVYANTTDFVNWPVHQLQTAGKKQCCLLVVILIADMTSYSKPLSVYELRHNLSVIS